MRRTLVSTRGFHAPRQSGRVPPPAETTTDSTTSSAATASVSTVNAGPPSATTPFSSVANVKSTAREGNKAAPASPPSLSATTTVSSIPSPPTASAPASPKSTPIKAKTRTSTSSKSTSPDDDKIINGYLNAANAGKRATVPTATTTAFTTTTAKEPGARAHPLAASLASRGALSGHFGANHLRRGSRREEETTATVTPGDEERLRASSNESSQPTLASEWLKAFNAKTVHAHDDREKSASQAPHENARGSHKRARALSPESASSGAAENQRESQQTLDTLYSARSSATMNAVDSPRPSRRLTAPHMTHATRTVFYPPPAELVTAATAATATSRQNPVEAPSMSIGHADAAHREMPRDSVVASAVVPTPPPSLSSNQHTAAIESDRGGGAGATLTSSNVTMPDQHHSDPFVGEAPSEVNLPASAGVAVPPGVPPSVVASSRATSAAPAGGGGFLSALAHQQQHQQPRQSHGPGPNGSFPPGSSLSDPSCGESPLPSHSFVSPASALPQVPTPACVPLALGEGPPQPPVRHPARAPGTTTPPRQPVASALSISQRSTSSQDRSLLADSPTGTPPSPCKNMAVRSSVGGVLPAPATTTEAATREQAVGGEVPPHSTSRLDPLAAYPNAYAAAATPTRSDAFTHASYAAPPASPPPSKPPLSNHHHHNNPHSGTEGLSTPTPTSTPSYATASGNTPAFAWSSWAAAAHFTLPAGEEEEEEPANGVMTAEHAAELDREMAEDLRLSTDVAFTPSAAGSAAPPHFSQSSMLQEEEREEDGEQCDGHHRRRADEEGEEPSSLTRFLVQADRQRSSAGMSAQRTTENAERAMTCSPTMLHGSVAAPANTVPEGNVSGVVASDYSSTVAHSLPVPPRASAGQMGGGVEAGHDGPGSAAAIHEAVPITDEQSGAAVRLAALVGPSSSALPVPSSAVSHFMQDRTPPRSLSAALTCEMGRGIPLVLAATAAAGSANGGSGGAVGGATRTRTVFSFSSSKSAHREAATVPAVAAAAVAEDVATDAWPPRPMPLPEMAQEKDEPSGRFPLIDDSIGKKTPQQASSLPSEGNEEAKNAPLADPGWQHPPVHVDASPLHASPPLSTFENEEASVPLFNAPPVPERAFTTSSSTPTHPVPHTAPTSEFPPSTLMKTASLSPIRPLDATQSPAKPTRTCFTLRSIGLSMTAAPHTAPTQLSGSQHSNSLGPLPRDPAITTLLDGGGGTSGRSVTEAAETASLTAAGVFGESAVPTVRLRVPVTGSHHAAVGAADQLREPPTSMYIEDESSNTASHLQRATHHHRDVEGTKLSVVSPPAVPDDPSALTSRILQETVPFAEALLSDVPTAFATHASDPSARTVAPQRDTPVDSLRRIALPLSPAVAAEHTGPSMEATADKPLPSSTPPPPSHLPSHTTPSTPLFPPSPSLSDTFYDLPRGVGDFYASRRRVTTLYDWQHELLTQPEVRGGRSFVYSLPTSGGKTLVAELSLLRCVMNRRQSCLFVVPFVSLAEEKTLALQPLATSFAFNVDGHYGSTGRFPLSAAPSIYVCTIEKANSVLNHMLEEGRTNELGAVVVDELHMIGESRRGATLELFLSKLLLIDTERETQRSKCQQHLGRLSARNTNPATQKPLVLGDAGMPDDEDDPWAEQEQYNGYEDETAAVTKVPAAPFKDPGPLQIIGMSATIPNLHVIAAWLRAACFIRDFRPVPLHAYSVVGGLVLREGEQNERNLSGDSVTQHLLELATEVPDASVLVFCASRQQCVDTAKGIVNFLKAQALAGQQVPWMAGGGVNTNGVAAADGARNAPGAPSSSVSSPSFSVLGTSFPESASKSAIAAVPAQTTAAVRSLMAELDALAHYEASQLNEVVPHGVAFHHGGLLVEERELIETAFRRKYIRILCCTSTLAAGVNLPARRVIIKTPYVGRDFLTKSRYLQMCGRAGRAGLDPYGESYLLLTRRDQSRGHALMHSDVEACRSQLLEDDQTLTRSLLECVGVGLVTDSRSAHRWSAALFGRYAVGTLDRVWHQFLVSRDGQSGVSNAGNGEAQAALPSSAAAAAATGTAAAGISGGAGPFSASPSTGPANHSDVATATWEESQSSRSLPVPPPATVPLFGVSSGVSPRSLDMVSSSAMSAMVRASLITLARCGLVTVSGDDAAAEEESRGRVMHTHWPSEEGGCSLPCAVVAELTNPSASTAAAGSSTALKVTKSSGSLVVEAGREEEACVSDSTPVLIRVTPFGSSSVRSCFSVEEALLLRDELEELRHTGLILSDDLHLCYFLTPVREVGDCDWELLRLMMSRMSDSRQRIAGLLGVDAYFIDQQAMGFGKTMQTTDEGRRRFFTAKRFYVALMLADVLAEVPMATVEQRYNVNRGQLQNLMRSASMFSSSITSFCHAMEWFSLEAVLASFVKRLGFGVKPDILPLMEIHGMQPPRARALWNAGYKKLAAVAAAEAEEMVCKVKAQNPPESKAAKFFTKRSALMAIREATLALQNQIREKRGELQELTVRGNGGTTDSGRDGGSRLMRP